MKRLLLFVLVTFVLVLSAYGCMASSNNPEAVSQDAGVEAYLTAQQVVLKNLKAPSTAKFSELHVDDETGYMALGNNRYEAWGWVDAENSFGAMLRNKWRIVLEAFPENQYKVLFVRIGTEETGDYLDAITGK